MCGTLPSGIWHANYYDWEKNPRSWDAVHAIRALRCQSSHVVDPHTPIVPRGRVRGLSYINKNIVQQDFTRGCVHERESFTGVSLFVQMALVLTRSHRWLSYTVSCSEGFYFKRNINLEKRCDTKNLTYCHKNNFKFNLLQWILGGIIPGVLSYESYKCNRWTWYDACLMWSWGATGSADGPTAPS